MAKPVCKYGAGCYRKNPDHFKQYAHPGRKEKAGEGKGGSGEAREEHKTKVAGQVISWLLILQLPPQVLTFEPKGEEAAVVIEAFFGKRAEGGKELKREGRRAEGGKELKREGRRAEGGKELKRDREGETGIVDEGLSSESGPPAKRTKQEAKEIGPLAKRTKEEAKADGTAKHDSKSRESYVESEELARESEDERENVRRKFLVDMPEDFYHFWDFCKSLNTSRPEAALEPSLGLKLVGPYHVLSGQLRGVPWQRCVLHWRYFYDPPELLTVIAGDSTAGFHLGYFRDDPKSKRCFVASNSAKLSCEIKPEAENIFGAVHLQIAKKLGDKSITSSQRKHLTELESKLTAKTKELGLPLGDPKALARQRGKEIQARCIHKIGIVVPYDKTTELGYRPLPMTDRELQKLMDRIASCKDKTRRDREFEPLQEIITFVQFANDECDYGMGLELGLDLFCHGDQFHDVVQHLLPVAYELLQREACAKIIQEHLRQRSHTPLDFTT